MKRKFGLLALLIHCGGFLFRADDFNVMCNTVVDYEQGPRGCSGVQVPVVGVLLSVSHGVGPLGVKRFRWKCGISRYATSSLRRVGGAATARPEKGPFCLFGTDRNLGGRFQIHSSAMTQPCRVQLRPRSKPTPPHTDNEALEKHAQTIPLQLL